MKKLVLATAVLMGSVMAMPAAMADNYWGQNRAAANHARHAQMKHMKEVRKHQRMERRKARHQVRYARHHRPAYVAPAVVIR